MVPSSVPVVVGATPSSVTGPPSVVDEGGSAPVVPSMPAPLVVEASLGIGSSVVLVSTPVVPSDVAAPVPAPVEPNVHDASTPHPSAATPKTLTPIQGPIARARGSSLQCTRCRRETTRVRAAPATRAWVTALAIAGCRSTGPEPASTPTPSPRPADSAQVVPPAPTADPEEIAAARARSPIKSDESVIVFPAAAWRDDAGWHVPVHAWIFEPELGSWRRTAFVEALAEVLGDEVEHSPLFRSRVQPFLYDNEGGKRLSAAAGPRVIDLSESGADGHCEGEATFEGTVGPLGPVDVLAPPDDHRDFSSIAFFVPSEGLTIISDIDDTVKISHVTDKATLLRKTFVEPFEAVPKMAQRYQQWLRAAPGGHLHFVSASPWQLYPALTAFLTEAGFPPASFSLKTLRLKDPKALEVLGSTKEAKVASIGAHIGRYPGRRFALFGDTGEHDPEVYGAIARRFADQVVYIAIRNVTGEAVGDARFSAAFEGVAAKWELFDDPDTLAGPPAP